MDLATERAAFAEAASRFDAVVAQTLASDERKGPSLLGRFMATVQEFTGPPKVSLNDAWKGILAARKVLGALSDNASTYEEEHLYNGLLLILTDELTRVVAADWQSRTKSYAPYTKAFTDAAESLKAAKAKADKLAGQLNLAADVLGAFTKLLGAFSG
jgi:hypothetical protein